MPISRHSVSSRSFWSARPPAPQHACGADQRGPDQRPRGRDRGNGGGRVVGAQRDAVVRTLSDIEGHLAKRIHQSPAERSKTSQFQTIASEILPGLGDDRQALTVPEMLLLSAVDRTATASPPKPRMLRTLCDREPATASEAQGQRHARRRRARAGRRKAPGRACSGLVPLLCGRRQEGRRGPAGAAGGAARDGERESRRCGSEELLAESLPTHVAFELRTALDLAERLYPGQLADMPSAICVNWSASSSFAGSERRRSSSRRWAPGWGAKGAAQQLSDSMQMALQALKEELFPSPAPSSPRCAPPRATPARRSPRPSARGRRPAPPRSRA